MTFVEELRWRGLIHDMMPGTEEMLNNGMTAGYIGFDPTSDSLHIGSLAQIMILKQFQLHGHKPIALVGGATGMIGDPSGKSAERNLLTIELLRINEEGMKRQLAKFLDFTSASPNAALLVNNYDWTKDYLFLDFIRDIGKHITINYMMSKDSVQNRLETGISYTEFTYQLLQGYDFLFLYQNYNCKLQMGGSDQWGNITTGNELIKRKIGGEAFALTAPLIKKQDGTKFGKTEKGNVWLDPTKTSPYEFYQFWVNTADADAERYIKIFTLLTKDEIDNLIAEHQKAPNARLLQKRLAQEVTTMVHSDDDYRTAVDASEILFGKGTAETLTKLDENSFLSIFEGVPQFKVAKEEIENSINVLDLLAVKTSIFPSKAEIRRMIKEGGLSVNKHRLENEQVTFDTSKLINNKYLLVQKGKKNYSLIIVE